MGKKKILVVDDEPQLLEMIQMFLEIKGFEVIAANNGPEGLTKATAKKPGLILLDIMMPNMDGLEVLRKLKDDAETKNIPVVMLTGKSESKFMFRTQELGAVDYIIKPFDSKELLAVVNKYCVKAG